MTANARAIALLATAITSALAQNAAPTGQPEFEVASVKPNTSGARAVYIGAPSPGRFKAENVWLRFVIQLAWGVKDFQISGGPGWSATDRYDIDAKTDGNANLDQMKPMLQTLLKERFQLAFHREPKEMPVYTLVAAKGGLKLQATKEGSCVARGPNPPPPVPPTPGERRPDFCGNMTTSPRGLSGTGISMEQLVGALSNTLQRSVIDKTGFTGTFDVHMEWTQDQSTPGLMAPGLAPPVSEPPAEPAGVSIFTAIQEQLGLKLESARGPVEVFVMDHAERPGQN